MDKPVTLMFSKYIVCMFSKMNLQGNALNDLFLESLYFGIKYGSNVDYVEIMCL